MIKKQPLFTFYSFLGLVRIPLILSKRSDGVFFDYSGDGDFVYTQWFEAQGNDAFLALDTNNNGIVDNGTELFGNTTKLHESGNLAKHGFEALAQYDPPALGGNNDGVITAEDKVWDKLSLWLDIDADGVSTDAEMQSLDAHGLVMLSVTPKLNNRTDPAGNRMPFWAWAKGSAQGNNKFKMVNVFFASPFAKTNFQKPLF